MRRALTILLIALCLPAVLRAQIDSTRVAGLDSLLTQFYAAMELEDVDTKNAEADFLIRTCTDSLLRQHVALSVFDHYMESRVMGEEAVAIHVYDEWFEPGKVSFQGELDRMDAEVFVKFNRNSLIGMDAPRDTLLKPCGGREVLPAAGRTALIFFYDTHCAKCRLEFSVLPAVLSEADFKLNLYLVYNGSDKESWKSFRRQLRIRNKNVRVIHLWDPELESGYQFDYAVYATPRVFLVEPGGMIIGRRLEMENVRELLPVAGAIQKTYDKYK